jgi:malonyl-CoA decarboxylase
VAADFLAAADQATAQDEKSPVRLMLIRCAADYLGRQMEDGRPLDLVARFHLGNGARVERLNASADLSAKGLRQSYGLMVNYLYDLKRLDKYRSQLAQGKIPVSSKVEALYI